MVEDQPSVRGGLPILSLRIFTNFQKETNLQFSSMGHSSLFVGRYKWTVTDVAPCVQHAFRLWLHGKVSFNSQKIRGLDFNFSFRTVDRLSLSSLQFFQEHPTWS